MSTSKKTIKQWGQEAKSLEEELKEQMFPAKSLVPPVQMKHPVKPRSGLQLANQQAQYAINFQLQQFLSTSLRDLPISERTSRLIVLRYRHTHELQVAIQADYDTYKKEVLRVRAKLTKAKANE